MEQSPTHDSWLGDDRLTSEKDDASPLLTYRYEKYRQFAPYACEGKVERRQKRCTGRLMLKIFPISMLILCAFLYIPFYNRASDQPPKALVAGWSANTNRDTKVYVQPNNITTLHEPTDVCHKQQKNKLFLLIVVCSSTTNFEQRAAIRQTWGNYKKYLEISKLTAKVKEKYKHYNYSYDLYTEDFNISDVLKRNRRESGFAKLLPELAKALQNNLVTVKPEVEKRFEDDILPEFDMNKELGDQTENYDYVYDTNIMKIPPKGYEETPNLEKVLSMLKLDKNFPKVTEKMETGNTEVDFKLVFILGLPSSDNYTGVQRRIEEEVITHGDIIQEDFIDSYNNLTLKSIMMLKWITHKCDDIVRYILKTDDDMYINVPNLVENLRNRSRIFDAKARSGKEKEYLLIGDLICGARPVQDSNNKWYSPPYMYGGRVYPRYLSGTAYALSLDTAHALYKAALTTSYFHLEDIYITGMCALRAVPRVVPRDDAQFSYVRAGPCAPHARVSAHRMRAAHMHHLDHLLRDSAMRDRCERIRLTQVRRDMLRPKPLRKLTKKHIPY
ncbi:uncharacterized protein LOC115444507 isoform X2 [Manduca sexta]|uniref:Hexosyltransferase n=2 Tax=Manduca sexta TaxID=7130 RepID=A0A921Z601_MANSE|nr:uncharacterized protein LOC115444507 isoform X2 [Manduca sexta]KAG6451560.1 hypothetical protein O3G_MSEX007233 [Manduca sexta]